MPTISTLTVDVNARTSNFRAGLRTAGLGLAALAGAAVFAFKQFEDAEKILAQTDAVLTSTGGAANVTAEQVQDLAQSISDMTGIDDEAIQAGENLLLTFTNIRNEVGQGNDIFDQATMAITDMSVAMGTDMKSAAIQVGKALNDPVAGITALSRVGVKFTEETKERIAALVEEGNILKAQKIILAELSTEFAGSAEAQKTASGTMMTALGNLAEVIGGLLAPAITLLADGLTTVAGFLQDNLQPALRDIEAWFKKVWEIVGPLATRIGRELLEAVQQTWSALKTQLWPALQQVWEAVKALWEAVGPLIKIWLAIQALWVKIALEVLPPVVAALGFVIDKIATLIEWIAKAVDWIKDRFIAAWKAIEGPVMAVLGTIIGAVQDLIGWIRDAIHWLGQLGQGVAEDLGSAIDIGPGGGVTVGNPPESRGVASTRGAGLGAVNVTVNGWVGNDQQIAERVRAALLTGAARNGGSTGL